MPCLDCDEMTVLWRNDCWRGGGGNTIHFFFIFVLVGLKEACMSNFSFLGSFSGTSPGGLAGAGYFKIKAKSAQLSWILGWAWQYMYVILGSFISNKARKIAIWSSYICYCYPYDTYLSFATILCIDWVKLRLQNQHLCLQDNLAYGTYS